MHVHIHIYTRVCVCVPSIPTESLKSLSPFPSWCFRTTVSQWQYSFLIYAIWVSHLRIITGHRQIITDAFVCCLSIFSLMRRKWKRVMENGEKAPC